MITAEECKTVLSSKGNKYTDEEVNEIREILYQMKKIVDDLNPKEQLKANDKKI